MKTLDELLESIQVIDVENNMPDTPNQHDVEGWTGVVNDSGIIAYFANVEDALHYRLTIINNIMNKTRGVE